MWGKGLTVGGAIGLLAVVWMVAFGCSSPPVYPPDLGDPDAAMMGKKDVQVGGGDAIADVFDAGSDAPLPCESAPDGGCNGVMNCGQRVPVMAVIGTAPKATGGTIADGTYALTAYNLIFAMGTAGPTGTWIRETVVITGTSFQIASETDSSSLVTVNATVASVPPSTLTFTYTCQMGPLTSVSYSFVPGTLILFVAGSNNTGMATYTKM